MPIEPLQTRPGARQADLQGARHLETMGGCIASQCVLADPRYLQAILCQTLAVDRRQTRQIQTGQGPIQTALLRSGTRQVIEGTRHPPQRAKLCQIALAGLGKYLPRRALRQHGKPATQPFNVRIFPVASFSQAPEQGFFSGTQFIVVILVKRWFVLNQLPFNPKLLKGIQQKRRRWQPINMHLAQCVVRDTADVANPGQGCVIKPLSHMPQPPQQGRAIPLQGLLMAVTPGTGIVVLEHRLISLAVRRVQDLPYVQYLVMGLLINLLIHLNIEPPLDLILSQRIGLELRNQRAITLIRDQVRLP